MSAPEKNQNATKPEEAKASSMLQVRCRCRDKAGWVKAARGRPLTEWVIEKLNTAAGIKAD